MDTWVLQTQRWLNNTFGNHKEWIRLAEDGITGSGTISGLIRGFQIENGLSPSTGSVGPGTRAKFKQLDIISKMDPNGPTSNNVFLIQGALFCKGYNAGGLTGIFYNKGIEAIKKLQDDAGISISGTIGWKEWFALLSMNWFNFSSSGNLEMQQVQRYLNRKYSDKINYIGQCDGVVSRQTIFSLIAAVQSLGNINIEEDINNTVFGPMTLNICDKLYKEKNKSYYELIKCGLCLNGYTADHDNNSDLTIITQGLINDFLRDYGLLGLNQFIMNEPTSGVMKSLLTSNGIDRDAQACDCATILNEQQAKDLKIAGYNYVGRYLTGTVGVGVNEKSKALTTTEINSIIKAGLSIFPIYQNGGSSQKYFKNEIQGAKDAITAIQAANKLGFKENSVIYFAVDYDCFGSDINNYIIPYFKKINLIFNSKENTRNFNVGIYAPREVCTKLSKFTKYSFVCDMSTGFTGNLGKKIPLNWAFDQFKEFKFNSSPTFDLDKNGFSGRDKGCNQFTPLANDESFELEEYAARMAYLYDFVDSMGYLDQFVDLRINFEKSHLLNMYNTLDHQVLVKITPSVRARKVSDNPLYIEFDQNGDLTTGLKNEINEICKKIEPTGEAANLEKWLKNIAFSVKIGHLYAKIEIVNALTVKLIFVLSTDNLEVIKDQDIMKNIEASCSLEILITKTNHFPNSELLTDEEFLKKTAMAVIGVGVMYLYVSSGFAVFNSALTAIGVFLFQ